jgi:hypothetical protein
MNGSFVGLHQMVQALAILTLAAELAGSVTKLLLGSEVGLEALGALLGGIVVCAQSEEWGGIEDW